MSHSPSPVLLHLRDGEMLAIDAVVWLSVVRGRVWVTRAHDPDDHFLDCGQAMRLAPGTQAIVGAEGAATVTLASAPSWRDGMRCLIERWRARPASPGLRPRTSAG